MCIVRIQHDKEVEEMVSILGSMFTRRRDAFDHATSSWREQLRDALNPQGGVDEHGNTLNLTFGDFFLHYISIFWKLLFCLVPPTAYLGGWPTFVVSLMFIGALISVVGEMATLFGCAVGLNDTVTAITFVAVGTSLPDTFASRNAAKEATDADAAISNANGTTTNNVLLGLGLPWAICATYYHVVLGRPYCVPSGALAFSVIIFSGCAVCYAVIVLLRRWLVGGELGGPAPSAWLSSVTLACLWVFYIVMSSLQSYGYIAFGQVYELDSNGCRIDPASA
mmetsp:Transcript_35296/g.99926  ORF Transcript_35296/g.99926 Transcript_35296/m.99926 type:complete len:280 (-) Transcript_35296:571-1410(-)